MTSVTPFGPLKKLQMSMAPPKTSIDLENNMLYSADAGVGCTKSYLMGEKIRALALNEVLSLL